jgi:hypothetical protein
MDGLVTILKKLISSYYEAITTALNILVEAAVQVNHQSSSQQ